MSATECWLTQGGTTQTIAVGVTRYLPITSGFLSTALTTEADGERTIRSDGTISKLALRLSANALTLAAIVVRLRKNTADGNQTFTIAAGTTGWFEDAVNTDSVTAGDEVTVRLAVDALGINTATPKAMGILFAASTNTVALMGGNVAAALGLSGTGSIPMAGTIAFATTEANAQCRTKTAAVLKNLQYKVTANTRDSTTTGRTRVNAANGAMSFTIAATTTGVFEDNSNTDTLAADDLFNGSLTTATGTGSITLVLAALEFQTTNSTSMWGAGDAGGISANATDATTYRPPSGSPLSSTTSTENVIDARAAFTASKLQIRVTANTTDGAALLGFRINNAAGAQSASVTAATTGWFEDASNTDAVVAGNDVNLELNPAGTAGALTFRHFGFLATYPSAGGVVGRLLGSSLLRGGILAGRLAR